MPTLKKLLLYLSITLSITLKAAAVDEIVITFNQTQLCANSTYDIIYTSTLPFGTLYKLQLFKAGVEIKMRESTANPFVFSIPYEAFYGTDYSMKLSAGTIESALLDYITIGNVSNMSIKDQYGFNLNNYVVCASSVLDFSLTLTRNSNYSLGEPVNGPIAYQWQKNDIDLNNTTNSISISEPATYKLIITQNNCTSTRQFSLSNNTSEIILLNIYDSKSYCEGSEIKLMPWYASNNSTFQWQKDFVDIPGAINREYMVSKTGKYSLKITNSNCPQPLTTYTGLINFANSLPAILEKSDNVLCGNDPSKNNVYLNIGIDTYDYYAGPEYPFSTIFQKDGVDIPNSASTGFLKVNEPGTYRLKVSQGNCVSYSADQEVISGTQFSKPVFNGNLETNSICDGSFSIYWNNQGNVYKNNVQIETNKYGVNTNQSGTYKLIRGDGTSCAVESDPITISIGSNIIPVINATKTQFCGPSDLILLGMRYSFSSQNLSFQWQLNGNDILNQTNPSLFRYAYEPLGTFRIKIINGSCTEYSNEITLTTTQTETFNLSTLNGDSQILGCSNRFVTIGPENDIFNSSGLDNGLPKSWYRNGVLISGENNIKLNVTQSGIYQLIKNGSGCTSTSNSLTIQSDFVPKPSITQTYTSTGASATLTAFGCTGTVKWWDSISATTPLNTGTTFKTPILNAATDYFASCASINCESARTKRTVILDQITDQISISIANTTFCAGSTISIPFTSTFSTGTLHKIQLLKNGVELANSESSANPISLQIPTTAVYSTDYSIKISAFGIESNAVVVTVLNPTVSQTTIFTSGNGTLTATGCGMSGVLWKNTSNNNINYTSGGNPFNIFNVTSPVTYEVKCTTGTCETNTITYNVVITVPTISINNYPKNMCAGTNQTFDISTNLPANTYFSIYLLKNGQAPLNMGAAPLTNGQIIFNPYQYNAPNCIGCAIKLEFGTISATTAFDVNLGNLFNAQFLDLEGGYLGGFKSFCTGITTNLGVQIAVSKNNIAWDLIENVTFQWQKDNVNIGTNQNPISISEAGNYKVVAQIGGCTTTSQNLQIQLGNSLSGSILPFANNFCENTPVRIYTDYSTNSATYQWKLNDINIPNANNKEYYPTVAGQYKVLITDKTCTITLGTKNIQFSDALPAQLSTTSLTICNGSSVNLNANNYDGGGTMYNAYGTNFIWQKDGVDIANQTNLFYSANTTGTYRYKLTQGTCTSYSREVQVVNGVQWEKPTIQNVLNTGTCLGYVPLNWNSAGTVYRDNVAIAQNVNNYNATQSGVYKLVMGEGNSCASTSDEVTVTIGAINPKITSNRTVLCGFADFINLSFFSQAVFNSAFSYQWQRDGIDLPNTQSSGITVVEPGTYKLKVTNGTCSEFSNEIVVTRNNNLTIDLTPAYNETIATIQNLNCTNRLVSLQADFLFNVNISATWYRNGIQISNVSKSSIYTPQAGTYTATATGFGCTATSNPFVINSDYVPQPTLTQSITYMNTSASLEATGCNGTVNWFDSQTSTTSLGTGPTFNTPNLPTGLPYFADCTSPTCKSAREKIDVIVEPCAQMTTVKSGDWNDPTVWSCNRIPYDLESVTIANNHSILIPTNYTAKVKDIVNNGGIIVGENATLQFKTN